MNPLIIGSALGAGIGGGLVLIRRGLTAAHIPLGDVFKTAESQSPCTLPRTPGGNSPDAPCGCRAHPGRSSTDAPCGRVHICRAHPGGNVHGLGSRPKRSRGQPDAGWTEQAYAGWTDEPDAGWTEGGSVPSR